MVEGAYPNKMEEVLKLLDQYKVVRGGTHKKNRIDQDWISYKKIKGKSTRHTPIMNIR